MRVPRLLRAATPLVGAALRCSVAVLPCLLKQGMARQPGRVRRRGGLQGLVLMASLLLALLGGDTARGQTEHDADQAQTSPSVPPYIQRGNEVEARYWAYRERLH